MGETIRLQGLLQGCAPRSDLDRLQLLADQTRMQLEASRGELQGELDRTHAELAVCRLREAALEAKIGQAAASATQEVDMVAARVRLELVEASLADARASAVRLGEELALVREGSVPKVQYESLLARCERLEAMHKHDLEDQGLRATANDPQEPEELKQLAGGGRWNDRGCSGAVGQMRDLWASMGLSAATVGAWPSKPSLVSATHTA